MRSLAEHTNPNREYKIFAYSQDISESNKQLLKSCVEQYSNISVVLSPNEKITQEIEKAGARGPFPSGLWIRTILPYAMPELKRLISVDLDTQLRHDIAELYDADLSDCSIGVVKDPPMQGKYAGDEYWKPAKQNVRKWLDESVKIKDIQNYFNTGVILYDTERFMQTLPIEVILAEIGKEQYVSPEQDLLNKLLEGKVKYLDMRWNTVVAVSDHAEYSITHAPEQLLQEYRKAKEDPYLLHWGASPKPWVCPDVEYGHEWWATAQRTPFMGHIIARMIDELTVRREHYLKKYGKNVDAWEPSPQNVNRKLGDDRESGK